MKKVLGVLLSAGFVLLVVWLARKWSVTARIFGGSTAA